MRIPASVIVMSLVTAVPFGLAIRDTARHHDNTADDEVDFDGTASARREREADMKTYEENEAKEKAEAAERRALVVKRFHEMYGAQPASLGSLFEGVKLGDHAADAASSRIDDYAGATSTSIELEPMDKPDRIKITVDNGDDASSACGALDAQLATAWSAPAPHGDDDTGSLWLDRAAGQIAWFHHSDGDDKCSFVFARVADPTALVTKTATSIVPMWAFGGTTTKLLDQLPSDATINDDAIIWDAPGLGATEKPTRLEADLTNGKITNLDASGTTDDATFVALGQQLKKLYGSAKTDESGSLHWNHPSMSLSRAGNTWLLGIGATPP